MNTFKDIPFYTPFVWAYHLHTARKWLAKGWLPVALLALTPFVTRAASDTLNGASWNTTAFWSLGALPGINDNVIIAFAGTVNVAPQFVSQREFQDIAFNSSGALTLRNSSTSSSSANDLTFTLNGGRGAGVPIISSVGDFAYLFDGQNTSGRKFNLQLKMGRASGDISVGANTGTNPLTINSIISETGGAQGINKTGAGRLILGGANTFTGGTTITSGVLEAKVNGALGTGVTNVNGGTLEINLAGATLTASSISVNAGGQIATRNATLNSAVTLNGGVLAARGGDSGTFAGAVNVTASSSVSLLEYTVPTTSQSITISGLLSGNGTLAINGADPQTNGGNKALILTNTGNNYNGAFNIGSGQILRSLPATTGNTLGTGSLGLSGGTLQLRDNGAGSSGTLTYGNNVTVSSAAGNVDVDRVGGANTGNTFQLGALSIGVQTLNVTGANGYGVRFAGATTLTGDATFNPTTATATLGGAVGGGFGITKTGGGNLVLSATNTYTGNTTVHAGTLKLASGGGIASSANIIVGDAGSSGTHLDVTTKTGGFTIGAAQTLKGIGQIDGNTTILGTHGPGNSPGLQTFNGNLTYGAGSIMNWELAANVSTDTIAIRGLDFDGVDVINTGGLTVGTGVTSNLIFNTAGSKANWNDAFWDSSHSWLVYSDANLPSLASASIFDTISVSTDSLGATLQDGTFSWNEVGNDVFLEFSAAPVPEPGSFGLLLAGILGLLDHRRRKD